ncbi:MAG: hypothetical protein AB1714_06050 [Acidobacteriota bacterium]
MGENTPFLYAVHGIVVCSNRRLDIFAPFDGKSVPVLDIWLGNLNELCQRHPEINSLVLQHEGFRPSQDVLPSKNMSQGDVFLNCAGGEHHLVVAVLSATGNSIEVGWRCAPGGSEAGMEEAVAGYLMTNLLGMAMRLSGQIVLHGNAVRVGDRAVIWAGDKGAGKSTLAAAFLNAGYPLLADDQVVIRPVGDGFMVTRGIRRLRLFTEGGQIRRLLEAAYPFHEPFGPTIKGYFDVDWNGERLVADRLTHLSAVYVIQPRGAEIRSPVIGTPRPSAQLHLLLSHCVGRRTLALSAAQQRAEFYAMGKMVGRVPVRFLRMPDDLARLPEAVSLLVARCGHD